jgi:hypothetical protein
MAFNLSEIDFDLYVAVNAAVQGGLLVVIVLPTAILSIICSVAIGFTFIINWQMRVILINIFATEVFHWLGYTVEYLAFAPRALDKEYSIVSCRMFYSFVIIAGIQKFAAIIIYSIVVYVFLKYGVKKLKWYVISLALVITWAVSVTIGTLASFDQFEVINNNGICRVITTALFYHITISFVLSSTVVGSCIIVFFSILSYRFLKKNTLEGNVDVKRAASKNLFFLAAAVVITTICQILPSFSPLIRLILPDYRYSIAYNYFLRLVISFPNIATPIIAIFALKPVQLATKNAFKKILLCKGNNTITPATEEQQ